MDFLTIIATIFSGVVIALLLEGAFLIVQDKEQEFHQRKATKHKE
jgi:hypothetical protein